MTHMTLVFHDNLKNLTYLSAHHTDILSSTAVISFFLYVPLVLLLSDL